MVRRLHHIDRPIAKLVSQPDADQPINHLATLISVAYELDKMGLFEERFSISPLPRHRHRAGGQRGGGCECFHMCRRGAKAVRAGRKDNVAVMDEADLVNNGLPQIRPSA